MSDIISSRVVMLDRFAHGKALDESNFSIKSKDVPPLSDEEFLLRTLDLSPDPYMRGRMTGIDSFFLPQFSLDQPISGFGVGQIIESRNANFQPGQIVHGTIEWAEYSVCNSAEELRGVGGFHILDPAIKPYHRALDILGITGLTAYFGTVEVAKPQRGETMLISGAAGSIGSIAGQIAKTFGARVIGIAGSDKKCAVLTGQLGFDASLNYRSETLESDLRELMPNGPDVYFDNVGGNLTQMVMKQMRRPGRIVECGQISTYDDEGGGWTLDIRPIHGQGLRWEGFTPALFLDFFPAALAQLRHWLQTGRIIPLETILHGIENAPASLAGLFRGENIGKMILNIAD